MSCAPNLSAAGRPQLETLAGRQRVARYLGRGRLVQLVNEHDCADNGHEGQNRTVQLQPQAPRHTIPLKVCPRAAKLTVGGSQIGPSRDPALDGTQARKTRAKCNESRELRMAPQGAVIDVAILRQPREGVAREGLALEL